MKYLPILFCLLCSGLFPQSILIDNYSSNEGLSYGNVLSIVQDNTGFIWFGTEDGLNRYDGYDFRVYKNIPDDSTSLSNNFISTLIKDREGFIWAGTSDGLNKLNPITGKTQRFLFKEGDPNSLQSKTIISLGQDNNGNILAGTYLGGLSIFNKNKNNFTTFRHNPADPNSVGSDNILAIHIDKEGIIWLAVPPVGLCRFDPVKKQFITFFINGLNAPDGFLSLVTSIADNDDGNLYLGTFKGLVIFNKKNFTFSRIEKINDSDGKTVDIKRILKLNKDNKGNIYLGTSEEGLIIFNTKNNKYSILNKSSDASRNIHDNYVNSVYIDRDENLWVGTLLGGLNKIRTGKAFKLINHNTSPALGDSQTRSIFEDESHNILIGTSGGLNIVNTGKKILKNITVKPHDKKSLSSNRISSICKGDSGSYWIGTNKGINQIDKNFNVIKKFGDQGVNVISSFRDHSGNLWFGTYAFGLYMYNPAADTLHHFVSVSGDKNSLTDLVIFDISEDINNNLWVAGALGLNKYDPVNKKFVRFTHEERNKKGLPVDEINMICPDQDGTLWLATQGAGVIKFDQMKGVVQSFNTKNGLANDVANCLVKDNDGSLWVGTLTGLSKIDLKSNTVYTFDDKDGLLEGFAIGACYKRSNGELIFGGDGIVYFNPANIPVESNKSPVVITGIKLFDKPLHGKEIFTDGDTIQLNYNDNFFSFQFAALNYEDPSKIRYASMLEGVDKDWNFNERRFTSYTNIDPGKYIFKVKIFTGGKWNSTGIAIHVIIPPPFWRTWWFETFIFLLLLSLVYSLIKHRINLLRKDAIAQELFSKQMMEVYETERKRIASELHDGLGQNLLIIANRAKLGLKKDDPSLIKKEFENISETALESIDDVRKIAYNLHPLQLEEFGISKALESMLKRIASLINIKLNYTIDNIDDLIPSERCIHLYRIIQETINNALKHSDAGEIEVFVMRDEKTLRVLVKDNGKGFIPGIKESGYGLRGLNERVKILEGSMEIESSPGNGTIFKFNIPVKSK
jgi:signal transduction histidine kinase/ligand-binding sensor domain-containing protein